MEHKQNDEPLFNVLQLLNNTLHHAMSSFNMKHLKYVLFGNSNVLVSLKKALLPMFNDMESHFWILKH